MIREVLSSLYPYIVILYLTDCIQFINKTHMLFVNYFGKKYYLKKSGLYFSKFSPIGITVLSHNIPVYFTASGLYKINDQNSNDKTVYAEDDYQFISYKDINTIGVDGKEVTLNGEKYIKAPSTIIANIIKDRIIGFKTIKPSKRIKKVRKIFKETFDIDKINSLNRSYSYYIKYIQILSLFLFFNMLILLPLALYSNIYLFINIYLIISYIIFTYLIVLFLTFYVHKKIYKNEKKPRLFSLLSMIFLPVSAMHAIHFITSDLYANFNCLAVARLLLPSDIFINLVRKEISLIEHKKIVVDHSDLLEYWELKMTFITNLVIKSGLTVDSVLAVPSKQDENATCYCPICLAEYISNHGKCSDCRVQLEAFSRS